MSKAHIESDEDRAAREAATVEVGKDNAGNPSFALMLFDPKNNLVQIPINTKPKPGWRYATRADIRAKAESAKKRPSS